MLVRCLLVVLPLAMCAGCGGGDPTAKLIGKWEAQFGESAEDSAIQEKGLQETVAGMAQDLVVKSWRMQTEFQQDGTYKHILTAWGLEQSTTGTWKYLKSEGNVRILEISKEGQPVTSIMRVALVDDDHIQLISNSGEAEEERLKLTRVNEDSSSQ